MSIICTTFYESYTSLIWHHFECIMFASMAVEKSRQNIWILVLNEVYTSLKTQSISLVSRYVAMRFYLTEHFCKIPRQNLCVTLPSSCS